ncbi:MAG: signal peptidase II [Lachnospiraceae bacterium]|nr:signal peptidase II [Lachnospiraceae bacterium]
MLLFFDQYTKFMAVLYLKDQRPIELIKDVFELRYLENRGAAFGSLQGKQLFLLVITGVVLIFLIYAYLKMPFQRRYYPLGFTVILLFAGAIGNMIDRISHKYVVDFLYFKLIDFPIFNVADCYVTIAAILLIILILFVYKDEELQFL